MDARRGDRVIWRDEQGRLRAGIVQRACPLQVWESHSAGPAAGSTWVDPDMVVLHLRYGPGGSAEGAD